MTAVLATRKRYATAEARSLNYNEIDRRRGKYINYSAADEQVGQSVTPLPMTPPQQGRSQRGACPQSSIKWIFMEQNWLC